MFHARVPFVNFYMTKSLNNKKQVLFWFKEIFQIFMMNKVAKDGALGHKLKLLIGYSYVK